MSSERLRRRDLERRIVGVRAPAGAADDWETRAQMLLTRLGDRAFLSHASAALLWGVPLPPHVERDDRIHVAVAAPARAPHAAGIVGHAISIDPADVVVLRGLRTTGPGRTWVDLARRLALPDLVAVGDRLIHHRSPLVGVEELTQRAAGIPAHLGRARLVRAIDLVDARAESRPETLLRLILVRAGLPQPAINHQMVDTETGRGLRIDFAYPARRIAIEYQGDYHRSREQWRADMRRRTRLERQGWIVIEANADDLRDPRELIARIRDALASRG